MNNVKVESRGKPFCNWCKKEIEGEAVKEDKDSGKVDYSFLSDDDSAAPRTNYFHRECYKNMIVSSGKKVEK